MTNLTLNNAKTILPKIGSWYGKKNISDPEALALGVKKSIIASG